MCDILHQRQLKFWYRPDLLFSLTNLKKLQNNLLETIHGLTRSVIKSKKEVFNFNLKQGKLPTPSLHDIISNEKDVAKAVKKARAQAMQKPGLRDDLDELEENDVGEKRRLAFLDLMIETAHYTKQLSDEEIKDQVNTIMFEGHDTTAAGSSFVLCMLGAHQDIQEKVMDEQRRIFGNTNRLVTFNDTLEMKYLERVIMETLRLYPPVPVIARKVNEDVRLVSNDYTIPADTTVVIGMFTIHRDPNNYENPDTFDPENFLSHKTQNRNYYSYIPFR
jgi:cytochrome P450 family 4